MTKRFSSFWSPNCPPSPPPADYSAGSGPLQAVPSQTSPCPSPFLVQQTPQLVNNHAPSGYRLQEVPPPPAVDHWTTGSTTTSTTTSYTDGAARLGNHVGDEPSYFAPRVANSLPRSASGPAGVTWGTGTKPGTVEVKPDTRRRTRMATLLTIGATFQLLVAFIVTMIAFLTDHWAMMEFGNVGLWSYCWLKSCKTFFHTDFIQMERRMPAWFIVTQGMMSMSVVTLVICLFLSLCNLCKHVRCLVITCGVLLIITGISQVAGLVLFALFLRQERDDFIHRLESLDWSYYLAQAGLLMVVITALLFFLMLRFTKRRYTSSSPPKSTVTYRRSRSDETKGIRSLDDFAIALPDDNDEDRHLYF